MELVVSDGIRGNGLRRPPAEHFPQALHSRASGVHRPIALQLIVLQVGAPSRQRSAACRPDPGSSQAGGSVVRHVLRKYLHELRQLLHAARLGQREFAAFLCPCCIVARCGRRSRTATQSPTARKARKRTPCARSDASGRGPNGQTRGTFSVKPAFGRPRRLASRAAAAKFMAKHYRL